ncbi:MAG: ABC transporter ATP-binding protein [Dehalococcoidia bacterium]
MLNVQDLHASYGPVLALQGVSLYVPEGGVIAVLGPNGAGKSSTLRAISGLLRASSGTIEFAGQRIDRLSPEAIVRLGISQVPEGRQTFAELTVRENLTIGAYTRGDGSGIRRDMDRVFSYFPVLAQRSKQTAGLLSGGEQQMLAIGRALMARPKLLLLDEPSMGLAPMLVREIFSIVETITREERLTIVVVEQDANLALDIAQHGYVLEAGAVVLDDAAAHLRANEAVRRAYLGY